MYSTCAIRPQICREGVIYLYFGLQSGHWTYGSGQFDFKSQIQRETNRMFSIHDERVPSVSSVTVYPGIPCSDAADAREFRLPPPGRELYSKGPG